MPNNPRAIANLRPSRKGMTHNPNGRPPKFATKLQLQGYKRSEINDTILNLLACTDAQFEDVLKNPDATKLERMIAKAVEVCADKGDVSILDSLLDRAHGKPKETVVVEQGDSIEAVAAQLADVILYFESTRPTEADFELMITQMAKLRGFNAQEFMPLVVAERAKLKESV